VITRKKKSQSGQANRRRRHRSVRYSRRHHRLHHHRSVRYSRRHHRLHHHSSVRYSRRHLRLHHHSSVRCSHRHLRNGNARCSHRLRYSRSNKTSRHHLRHSSVKCSHRLPYSRSNKSSRHRLRHSSVKCSHRRYSNKSSRPYRADTALEFRSLRLARSSKVSAAPGVSPGNHLVRFRHSSHLDSPPLPHPRCNHRYRRLGPRRRRRSAPSCRLRHRIMRAGSMTCAAPAGRCARATVS